MPTNIVAALAQRSHAPAAIPTDAALLLLALVVLCLANLTLALASPAVAEAVALLGRY